MIEAASDLRRGLPIVVNPIADEVLSSWLTRIAQDYFGVRTRAVRNRTLRARPGTY